jgi:hypothetical protein
VRGKPPSAITPLSTVSSRRTSIVPGEDEDVLREELSERLWNELQPVGEMEGLLVEQIIAAYWRLRRLRRVEAGIFA